VISPGTEDDAPRHTGATHTQDGRDLGELWQQFRRSGDTDSRNALTEFYFDMVRANSENIAEILLEAIEQNDLSQSGAVAFFEALNEYDPEEHGSFEDFGSMAIRRAIMEELRGLIGVDWTPKGES
jgi:DNA-directed RNA polymerase specialized sigma subunit